jgi:hypothetical protein
VAEAKHGKKQVEKQVKEWIDSYEKFKKAYETE